MSEDQVTEYIQERRQREATKQRKKMEKLEKKLNQEMLEWERHRVLAPDQIDTLDISTQWSESPASLWMKEQLERDLDQLAEIIGENPTEADMMEFQ